MEFAPLNPIIPQRYEALAVPKTATRFRTAMHTGDYAEAYTLTQANGWPDEKLIYPTILAARHGEVVGCICTRDVPGEILAGPLALAPGRPRPLLALALLRQYERTMRAMGIKRVTFDLQEGSPMYVAVTETMPHCPPFRGRGDIMWFLWDFAEFSLIGDI